MFKTLKAEWKLQAVARGGREHVLVLVHLCLFQVVPFLFSHPLGLSIQTLGLTVPGPPHLAPPKT